MSESIKFQPDFANALYFHGIAAHKLGKYTIAISSLEKAKALNDNFPNIKEYIEYAQYKEFEESIWECLSKDNEESETIEGSQSNLVSQSSLSGVALDSSSCDFVD